MSTVKFTVPNISCKHCAHTIKTELSDLAGVKSVEVAVDTKTVAVGFESPATEAKIADLLREINYPPAA